MKDAVKMALVSESGQPSPRVWQPWYMDETESVGKELPTRMHRDHRIRARTALQKSPRNTHSMANTREDIEERYRHHQHFAACDPAQYQQQHDDELPLDMSIKRRSPPLAHAPTTHPYTPPPHLRPSPPPAHTTFISASPPPFTLAHSSSITQVERPSVITCVSPRYALHEVAQPPPPPPSYSVATAHLRNPTHFAQTDTDSLYRHVTQASRSPSPQPSKRQLVEHIGAGDPDIEEHFRRSLGKNYHQLLSNADDPQDSTDSVDEHFTKALGETWLKLKASGDSPRRPSDSYSPISLPPPTRERVTLSARSATPPDVSITRVPATLVGQVSADLGQVS